MARGWATAKIDRDRARRSRANGVHGRFLQGEHREHDAKRAVAMPDHSLDAKHAMDAMAQACNLKAKRFSTGKHLLKDTITISDEHRRSRLMRKARGEIVRPESGRNAVNARKIAAPPMTGFLQSCWSKDTAWTIYKKS